MNNEVKRFINESSNYDVIDYINNLQQIEKEHQKLNGELRKEIQRLNNIINLIDNFVDRTIEVIKQQPTGDDEWILERLNGIKYLTELKENNDGK